MTWAANLEFVEKLKNAEKIPDKFPMANMNTANS